MKQKIDCVSDACTEVLVANSLDIFPVLSNDEVVSCIAGKEADVGAACEATVRLAAEKWDKQGSYRDDITCLIVTFDQNTA